MLALSLFLHQLFYHMAYCRGPSDFYTSSPLTPVPQCLVSFPCQQGEAPVPWHDLWSFEQLALAPAATIRSHALCFHCLMTSMHPFLCLSCLLILKTRHKRHLPSGFPPQVPCQVVTRSFPQDSPALSAALGQLLPRGICKQIVRWLEAPGSGGWLCLIHPCHLDLA